MSGFKRKTKRTQSARKSTLRTWPATKRKTEGKKKGKICFSEPGLRKVDRSIRMSWWHFSDWTRSQEFWEGKYITVLKE